MHGISEVLIYVWRKRFGDMVTDDERLRNLEQANGQLKKTLAERNLEIKVTKKATAKKRPAVELDWPKLVCHRARGQPMMGCTLLQVARSGLTYTCKMPIEDAPIAQAMRHYSGNYPRIGARRMRIFLRRDGMVLGGGRTARIWAKYGLQEPAKAPKKLYRPERTIPTE